MFRKFITIVICVFMVASSVIPQKNQMVYAYTPNESETQPEVVADPIEKYPTTTDTDFDISQVALLNEVDSLRTESTKTFQRVDGSFVVAMYGDVIHYQKDGKWTDIDNTLTYDSLTDSYENKNNGFKVKFPNSIDANKKIKLTMGDYSINWSISNISKSSIQYLNPEMKTNNIKDLIGISQEVMYQNVMKGVDVQYIITGSKVKENIILQSYIENFSLSFDYETRNLQLLSLDNDFLFVNEDGEIVFNLTDLYAIDASGVETDKVTIRVDEISKGKYKVIVSVDDIWLRNASYPVTIDPSISSKVENLSISDTYLQHTLFNTNTKYPSSTNIYCNNGNATILTAAHLGYINFVVPSFLKNYDITYATLNIHSYSTTSYGTLYLYELQDYHNLSTLEWTTPRVVGTRVIDYAKIENTGTYYRLDITTSVDKWNKQNLTSMPGFEMKSDGPLLKFYSMEASSYKPFLEIGFMDSEGIKDYWTYSSQDIGSAGTGYVSDFTQELSIVRNDITYETALQSLGVSFAYNNKISMSSTPNIGYGNGWNINYNISLHIGESSATYYIEDFTGSRSYYSLSTCDLRMEDYTPSICYLSEDGTGDKVVKHMDEYGQLDEIYLITKDNTKYSFDMTYYDLESISSLSNILTINIVRETSSRQKIDYVTDYRGNKIDFSYGENGNLDSALLYTFVGEDEYHQLEKVYYKYFENTNYLHDVYYLSNYNQNKNLLLNTANLSNVDKIARYDHYSTKQMNRVFMEYVNETTGTFTFGEDVRYHYVSSTSSQILNYESYYSLEKISQMNYDSSFNQTMISDHIGNFVLYKFDRYGHTVNIIGDNGNVLFHEYLDIFIDPSTRINGKYNYDKNHKIVNQSSPQNPVHNPVKNSGFESYLNNWTKFTAAGATFTTMTGLNYVKTGNASLRIRTSGSQYGYVNQTITLDEGIHNIYVDVKNCGLDEDDVYVLINGDSQSAENDSEWHRLTLPFLSLKTTHLSKFGWVATPREMSILTILLTIPILYHQE